MLGTTFSFFLETISLNSKNMSIALFLTMEHFSDRSRPLNFLSSLPGGFNFSKYLLDLKNGMVGSQLL